MLHVLIASLCIIIILNVWVAISRENKIARQLTQTAVELERTKIELAQWQWAYTDAEVELWDKVESGEIDLKDFDFPDPHSYDPRAYQWSLY